jgi:hypothetical protein
MEVHEGNGTPDYKNYVYAIDLQNARQGSAAHIRGVLQFAATLIERGEQLPDVMRGFIAEFLRGNIKIKQRKPGPDRWDLLNRDLEIVGAIEYITETWEIPPTRNYATKQRASAASIVQEALETAASVHLTETAINNIWNRTR